MRRAAAPEADLGYSLGLGQPRAFGVLAILAAALSVAPPAREDTAAFERGVSICGTPQQYRAMLDILWLGHVFLVGERPMTALTLELSTELVAQLHAEADRIGKPISTVVEEWLRERLPNTQPGDNREQARIALRAAGLLVENPLEPTLQRQVNGARLSLEQVSADLDQAGGQPLSEIILEQRGPKE